MCLAILGNSNYKESQRIATSTASRAIQTVFEAVFRDEACGTRRVDVDPYELFANQTSFMSTYLGRNFEFAKAGNLL